MKNLTFDLNSATGIPASGWIKIIADESLTLKDVSNSKCKVFKISSSIFVDSPNCYKRDKEIFIQLDDAYSLGINLQFKVENVFESPANAGTYNLEVITFAADLVTMNESYTENLVF